MPHVVQEVPLHDLKIRFWFVAPPHKIIGPVFLKEQKITTDCDLLDLEIWIHMITIWKGGGALKARVDVNNSDPLKK